VKFAGRVPRLARQAAPPTDEHGQGLCFEVSIYLWGAPSRASTTGRALGQAGRYTVGVRSVGRPSGSKSSSARVAQVRAT